MQIRAELCHVDTLRCIVRVEAWDGEHLQGSALGEAQTSEEAESRALRRLETRLAAATERPQGVVSAMGRPKAATTEHKRSEVQRQNEQPSDGGPTQKPLSTEQPSAEQPSAEQPTAEQASAAKPQEVETSHQQLSTPHPPSEAPTDPEDWSEELAAIDLEVRRIGWDRDMEGIYLQRAFGHSSRHRLTRYGDLVAFLRQLRQLQPGDPPETAATPLLRSDLINQGDSMLKQLKWSSAQARSFLQESLDANTRQQLDDQQLLQFNMLLEEQILNLSQSQPE